MSEEQIAKYEAWATRLEENIVSLTRQRSTFLYIFCGAIVVSGVGFFFGAWLGVATFATGLMVCVAGLYISTTRTWEYQRELEQTRFEVRRLRAEQEHAKSEAT
jgi:uncharacterized protein (DUF58 family)